MVTFCSFVIPSNEVFIENVFSPDAVGRIFKTTFASRDSPGAKIKIWGSIDTRLDHSVFPVTDKI